MDQRCSRAPQRQAAVQTCEASLLAQSRMMAFLAASACSKACSAQMTFFLWISCSMAKSVIRASNAAFRLANSASNR